jgi:hypothetical protein
MDSKTPADLAERIAAIAGEVLPPILGNEHARKVFIALRERPALPLEYLTSLLPSEEQRLAAVSRLAETGVAVYSTQHLRLTARGSRLLRYHYLFNKEQS